jgi:hypothetical protein
MRRSLRTKFFLSKGKVKINQPTLTNNFIKRFSPVASSNGKTSSMGPSTLSKPPQVSTSESHQVQQVSLLKSQSSMQSGESKMEPSVPNSQSDNSTTCRPKPIKMRLELNICWFPVLCFSILIIQFITLCCFCLFNFPFRFFSVFSKAVYSFLTECLLTAQAPPTVRSVQQ